MMAKQSMICLVALLSLVVVEAEKVSPVQKVIQLLDELKGKVKADLDAEASAMAEFTEWCDTEISDKGYAIKTAVRQIGDFKASIADGEATVAAKETEITETGTAISGVEAELAKATENRAKESADFKAEEKELTDSVDELAGAIVQIKRGASLMQVKKGLQPMAQVLSKIIEASSVNTFHKRQLNAFLQSSEDDGLSLKSPAQGSTDIGGGGHSDGILSTLEGMKTKAENQLSAARKADMQAAHNFQMTQMSLEQEAKNKKKSLAAATSMKATASEEVAKAQGEVAEVETSKAADESYLQTTKMDCEEKAAEWAARQEESGAETAAIEKAKQILADGVKAFVQLKTTTRVVDEDETVVARRHKLSSLLKGMAKKFNSYVLVQLAGAAKNDPFGKIKGLISEMIEKLLNEGAAETEQKAFCDKEISASKASQEEKTMKLDKFSARLDTATSTMAELREAIKTLEGEIAEIDRTNSEAQAIRTQENTDYLKASKDFKDSAEAVAAAMQVLKSYYEGSFIQVKASTKRASSGSKTRSVGGTIISVLEVAESDFAEMLAQAETAEESAAAAFAKLQQESGITKTTKQQEIKGKESEIKSLTVSMENYREDKAATGEELDAVLAYLDKLKPECEVKVMSYEEKVERREAEIEGLKQALSILEGQDIPVLIQKKAFLHRA